MTTKLTPAMRNVLVHIVAGRDPYCDCRGRSAYGGRVTTIAALRARGLIDHGNRSYEITEAGRGALKEQAK